MNDIKCIIICILTLMFPLKKLKKYCSKLADSTYLLTQNNENDCRSIAVRVYK